MYQYWNCFKKFIGPLVIITFLICAVFLGRMYVSSPRIASTNQSGRLQTSADTYTYAQEWNRTLDLSGNDQIWDMVIDEHFNYYLAGNSTGGPIQAWFAKFSANGTQLWNKTWPTGAFYGVAQNSSDHSVYLCGKFPSNACLIKLNSTGSMMWNYTLPELPAGKYEYEDIAISQSTNSIVMVAFNPSKVCGLVQKVASNGTTIWIKEIGGLNYGVTTDSQDNVIVITQGADNDEKFAIGVGKYHANGTRLWYNLWRGPSDGAYSMGARDVAVDSNDNIYVVGEIEYPDWNALLMKVDPEGNQLWNRTWGNQNIAFGVQVVGTDIYAAGSHCLFPNLDLWLLKYNSAGQFLWNFTCERPSVVGIPWECCLAKDHQNNLYIGGSVNQTNFDAFYMKFKATLTETETGAIPGFHFSLVWIPLVFLLLYIILRYKLPSLAEKRRI